MVVGDIHAIKELRVLGGTIPRTTRSLAYQPLELANIAGLTTAAASRHCSGRCASP
jgi:hypothetical protein